MADTNSLKKADETATDPEAADAATEASEESLESGGGNNAGDKIDTGASSNATEARGPEPAPDSSSPESPESGKPAKSGTPGGLRERLRKHVNIYFLLFVFVLVLGGAIILIAYLQNRHAATDKLKTQSLSQSTLDQLANGDVSVGDNQSVLKVQSSAVFAGQVLIRQSLEVAGNLRIGGTLALNNITVGGSSQLGQATVNKDLAVAGNTALQGTATVAKSLQVGGGGTFNGPLSAPQITTSTLQLNGDLVLTHHITIGGSQPSRSGGSALGSGGSASVSGSDTAGSININTGGGPPAGCFITVNFTSRYSSTPHVLVTPIDSAAGGLSYYVTRSSSNFSICVSSPPPAGASFGFDYFVVN